MNNSYDDDDGEGRSRGSSSESSSPSQTNSDSGSGSYSETSYSSSESSSSEISTKRPRKRPIRKNLANKHKNSTSAENKTSSQTAGERTTTEIGDFIQKFNPDSLSEEEERLSCDCGVEAKK